MADRAVGVLRAVISAALPLVPALWFGFQVKPTEMGLAIVAGSIAAAFLNLDRIQSFKGGGFEAVMRELQKAKEEANATIEDLRQISRPVVESTLQMLASSGRIGGIDIDTKHRLREDILRIAENVGIEADPAIRSADQNFVRVHTRDYLSSLVEHIRRKPGLSKPLQTALLQMVRNDTGEFPTRKEIETVLDGYALDEEEHRLLDAYISYQQHGTPKELQR